MNEEKIVLCLDRLNILEQETNYIRNILKSLLITEEGLEYVDGKFGRYTIITERKDGYYIVPEKDFIPRESWGNKVANKLIHFPIDEDYVRKIRVPTSLG